MRLQKVSIDFSTNNMIKTGLDGSAYDSSVDYSIIDTSNIIHIHNYLMKKHDCNMFGLTKKMFRALLIFIVNASNHTKCALLSNEKFEIQSTVVSLHSNEYSREFHYYPFTVKLDKCVESCNTLNDLSNKFCAPNKTEHLNLNVSNLITGIKESKTLIKHISCNCKCKFDGGNFNSDLWLSNDKC